MTTAESTLGRRPDCDEGITIGSSLISYGRNDGTEDV